MPAIQLRANRALLGWCLLLLVFAGALALWFVLLRPGSAPVTVSLAGWRTNNMGTQQTGFRVVNHGRVLVVWTGTWWTQVKGAPAVPNSSPSQISFLGPGASQTVWLPTPTNQGAWKVSFDYRPEDWRQRFKRSLGRSRLGRLFFSSVRRLPVHERHTAASDWVELPQAESGNK